MPRNHLNIRRQLRDYLGHGVDHAVDAAAALHVNEGKAVGDEVVAHVHDVGVREKDDRVAVGVSGGKIESADVFAVQVHGDIVIEGEDGQGLVRLRAWLHMDGAAVAAAAAALQALADVILRDDGRLLLEVCISAGVVGVIVRVDDETHGLVGDAFQCGLNLVG